MKMFYYEELSTDVVKELRVLLKGSEYLEGYLTLEDIYIFTPGEGHLEDKDVAVRLSLVNTSPVEYVSGVSSADDIVVQVDVWWKKEEDYFLSKRIRRAMENLGFGQQSTVYEGIEDGGFLKDTVVYRGSFYKMDHPINRV